MRRTAGILLHPTSLPGPGGIGTLGDAAIQFIDLLADLGQSWWQMLPTGPTGFANSPYQSPSTFAGNPLLIDLDLLVADGLIDVVDSPVFPRHRVDFGSLIPWKSALLDRAAKRFEDAAHLHSDYLRFLESQAWLDEFAVFTAIKRAHGLAPWWDWPEELRSRRMAALSAITSRLDSEIEAIRVEQFLFDRQFNRVREHARSRGVGLIGDIPIFVAHDSADVWASPELFELDLRGMPTKVAGVPPDYFAPTGQRWGNPLYAWNEHSRSGFAWWIARLRHAVALFDRVRIDHFRGFQAAWEIPAHEETAVHGEWVEAPGVELFDCLAGVIDPLPVIAEDLGVITPEVEALRDRYGFPGMKVLQFGFGTESAHSLDLAKENVVAYSGTHDNDTALGWISSRHPRDKAARAAALGRFGCTPPEFPARLIQALMDSVADTAIIPLQDHLGLGSKARMNVPGTSRGNWEWRATWSQLRRDAFGDLAHITRGSGRQAEGDPPT